MLKTAPRVIPYQAAKPTKTHGSQHIQSVPDLPTPTTIQTALSNLPRALALNTEDYRLILFTRANHGTAFDTWPRPFRDLRRVGRLAKRRILIRRHFPTHLALTKEGYEIAGLLDFSLEYSAARTATRT